jgi:diguanylate cyclase (GGDEF)-like protein/PAS domain S-box-containing protein
MWAGLFEFAAIERRSALDRAQTQLTSMVATLADFNELAARSRANDAAQADASRTAAFRHASLRYPTAGFWVDSHGQIVAGHVPAGNVPSVLAEDARGAFSVHASLPEADALVDWKHALWLSVVALASASLLFLVLTRSLASALRARATAAREAEASVVLAEQLVQYRTQLEETVARRTEELGEANSHLETELIERRSVQGELRERDALLNAVTTSAAELLGSQSVEDALATVLELIGETVSVSRVQWTKIQADASGHAWSSLRLEWCASGVVTLKGDPLFGDVDLSVDLPELVARLRAGDLASFYVDQIGSPDRERLELAGIRSVLCVPILVDDALLGSLNFIDSLQARRTWSLAETDTLKTLAGLLGIAIARERDVAELADANTIVVNSPTILYRLRGEPPFSLLYISNNIVKFGHDPAALLRSPDWAHDLVDERDREPVYAAMTEMVRRGAVGDSNEFRLRTGSGEERFVENRYSPRRDKDGRLLEIEGIIIDVTERKQAEQEIELLARTDFLTGLANRATFLERLHLAFEATARGAQPFAILYLDLDSFKSVNDTLGHCAGDELLREVARRLASCTRDGDVVARLGGDEFAVLQVGIAEATSAGVLAAKIQRALNLPYVLDGNEVQSSASIGICAHSETSSGPDAMLAQADLALYRSKNEGRNQYHFYSADLDRLLLGRIELAEDLRRALDDETLEVHFEPGVELATGKPVALKALLRWHHPTRGLLDSDAFIPLVETTASGIRLGRWLLDRACREMSRRRNEGTALPVVAIDVRYSQLKRGDELVRDVREILAAWNLTAADLEFDVTEETLARVTFAENHTLGRLRELGVKIVIADFGTAYSSLEYIRAYGVDRIVLSQSFLGDRFATPDRVVALHAVAKLARNLGLGIVVEGAITREQREAVFGPTLLPALALLE